MRTQTLKVHSENIEFTHRDETVEPYEAYRSAVNMTCLYDSPFGALEDAHIFRGYAAYSDDDQYSNKNVMRQFIADLKAAKGDQTVAPETDKVKALPAFTTKDTSDVEFFMNLFKEAKLKKTVKTAAVIERLRKYGIDPDNARVTLKLEQMNPKTIMAILNVKQTIDELRKDCGLAPLFKTKDEERYPKMKGMIAAFLTEKCNDHIWGHIWHKMEPARKVLDEKNYSNDYVGVQLIANNDFIEAWLKQEGCRLVQTPYRHANVVDANGYLVGRIVIKRYL